jgi:hypothetical protein
MQAAVVAVMTAVAFATAQQSPVLIGYVAANGTAVAVANDSIVLHVTNEDAGNNNNNNNVLRLWCDGFVSDGGWEVCRWYRPGNLTCSLSGTVSLTACGNGDGTFTSWSVERSTDGRCEAVVSGANSNDAGVWGCFLLGRSSSLPPLSDFVTIRRRPVEGLVSIITRPTAAVAPGSTVELECRVTARSTDAPRIRWLKYSGGSGGAGVSLPGNITDSQRVNITDQWTDDDPGWLVTNWLVVSAAPSPATTERFVCRAELGDDFGRSLVRSKEVTIATAAAADDGNSAGDNRTLEVGLAVGLSLLFLLLLLLVVLLLCWCCGFGCFRHRRRKGAAGLTKKKIQGSVFF